jgi:hypothetical protein
VYCISPDRHKSTEEIRIPGQIGQFLQQFRFGGPPTHSWVQHKLIHWKLQLILHCHADAGTVDENDKNREIIRPYGIDHITEAGVDLMNLMKS